MNHREASRLPIEFIFVVQCCQWNLRGGNGEDPPEIPAQMNWELFLATCRRHRVQGLVWNCLHSPGSALPDNVKEALANDARSIAETGLRSAQASLALLRSFTQAGIPLMFLKGLTVAKLAYGNAFLKAGWDIDVLVPSSAVGAAGLELEGLGYRLITPPGSANSETFINWHRVSKESVWAGSPGIFLELHTRLADNDQLIPGIDAFSPTQWVEVAQGIALPTLADEELFAYLSVHGASSAWFRLKWITDLAAILVDRTPTQIEQLYERSQHLGAGRAAALALILAHRLYDTPISENLSRLLHTRANRLLAWAAIKEMVKLGEPAARPLGTAAIHFTQFLMLPGIPFKLSELRRQVAVALRS